VTKPESPIKPSDQVPRKGPLSFLSGSLTAGLLAWLALGLSQKMVAYYALHPPSYGSAIAQSIATALKTMIVGMTFLATFSFAFVGLGLSLVFLRSLLPARPETPA
jgi:urea transporter